MVRTLQKIMDLLWPQDAVQAPDHTAAQPNQFKSSLFLLPYRNKSVQTLIKNNKYHAQSAAAETLAIMLDDYLDTLTEEFVIIPTPISYQRWRERGYNHIELILKKSRHWSQTRSGILIKSTHTTQQTQTTKSQRVSQQAGTFSCNQSKATQLPQTVILLDDVITTGSTMKAASKTLQACLPADTALVCLAIAH